MKKIQYILCFNFINSPSSILSMPETAKCPRANNQARANNETIVKKIVDIADKSLSNLKKMDDQKEKELEYADEKIYDLNTYGLDNPNKKIELLSEQLEALSKSVNIMNQIILIKKVNMALTSILQQICQQMSNNKQSDALQIANKIADTIKELLSDLEKTLIKKRQEIKDKNKKINNLNTSQENIDINRIKLQILNEKALEIVTSNLIIELTELLSSIMKIKNSSLQDK